MSAEPTDEIHIFGRRILGAVLAMAVLGNYDLSESRARQIREALEKRRGGKALA